MFQKTMPSWLPYAGPFAAFLLMTTLESQFPAHYPLMYLLKMIVVVSVIFVLKPKIPAGDRPNGSGLVLATALGVALFYVWIYGDQDTITHHFKWLGARTGYDPAFIIDPLQRNAFIGLRFFGLVVVVPVIEEMFYRGFLLRYVINPDNFQGVKVGKITLTALAVNVLFFAGTHPEWLVAAIFAAAMCGLLARSKNLFACIWAHAITNLLLGIYVMQSQDWQYW